MSEDNYSKRGSKAFAQGEKKLKPGILDRMLSNKDSRTDEATELFKLAANFYRMAKDCNS